MRFWRWM
jgi:hypothetical protein